MTTTNTTSEKEIHLLRKQADMMEMAALRAKIKEIDKMLDGKALEQEQGK